MNKNERKNMMKTKWRNRPDAPKGKTPAATLATSIAAQYKVLTGVEQLAECSRIIEKRDKVVDGDVLDFDDPFSKPEDRIFGNFWELQQSAGLVSGSDERIADAPADEEDSSTHSTPDVTRGAQETDPGTVAPPTNDVPPLGVLDSADSLYGDPRDIINNIVPPNPMSLVSLVGYVVFRSLPDPCLQ